MDQEEVGMQLNQREHITQNIDKLVEYTSYKELMAACVETGLVSEVMRDCIERTSPSSRILRKDDLERARHKQLLLKITKRGPDAYHHLKKLFVKLNYNVALNLLNEIDGDCENSSFISINNNKNVSRRLETKSKGTEFNEKNADDGPKLELYIENPDANYIVNKSIRIHNNTKVGTYSMKSKDHRGVLFMVNIIDFPDKERRRNGAEKDAQSMMHLFKEFGFKIFSYTNLTKESFFKLLAELISSDYTRDTECFVLALMTHGDRFRENDIAEFHEGLTVDIKDIENYFRHDVCQNLINKPKILIFPFCRGRNPDLGWHSSKNNENYVNETLILKPLQTDGSCSITSNQFSISSLSDTIICYATTPGYETHRDPVEGSWYIQTFCKLMATSAYDTNFEEILKMTQRHTGNRRGPTGSLQTGSYTNIGFNKLLYFNPGCWEE